MAILVLDASVAIAGLAPDESDSACVEIMARALSEAVAVPAIWFYEVANIFMMKYWRGLMSLDTLNHTLSSLSRLRVDYDAAGLQLQCEGALVLASHHNLTIYDASYLELALRLKLPLATVDRRLADAARNEGLQVLAG